MDVLLEKSRKELFASVNVKMMNFLTPTETATPAEPTKSSPMELASVPLDIVSTTVEFVLSHVVKVNSLSRVDVQFALSIPSTKLKSTDVIVQLVTTRTFSESVKNSP